MKISTIYKYLFSAYILYGAKAKKFVVVLLFGAALASCATSKKVPADANILVKDYFLINASNAYQKGDLKEAHQLLAQAITSYPACDACYYLLANVAAKSGAINDAARISKMAYALDTTNFWYGKQLARLLELSGDTENAIIIYNRLLAASRQEDTYYSLASLYARAKQYDKADAMYDTLQKYTGFSDRLLLSRQQMYYASGDNDKALSDAMQYYAVDKDDAQLNALIGEIYSRTGKSDSALYYLERAYKIDNSNAATLFALAEVYRVKSQYDKFYEILNNIAENRSITLNDKLQYFVPVAQFWSSDGDNVDKLFANLNNVYKNVWTSNEFYATFLAQTNRKPEAMQIVDSAIARNKTNADAWKLKISLLATDKNWQQALSTADTALATVAETNDILMYKAYVCSEMKNYDCVFSTLETPADTSKNKKFKIDAYAFLGDVYHSAGNNAKSYKYYDKTLQLDSTNIVVLNNYAYYLSVEGKNLKRALAMSKKTVDKEPYNATYLDTYGWILHELGRDEEAKPVFRKAMVSGGRESGVILEHYGDVLFDLKDYDTAIIYWEDALSKQDTENKPAIQLKIEKAKNLKSKK